MRGAYGGRVCAEGFKIIINACDLGAFSGAIKFKVFTSGMGLYLIALLVRCAFDFKATGTRISK
jgi:hypothetical protein